MNNIQNILNNLGSSEDNLISAKPIYVHYINNPDGSIRWVWPADSSSPLFLKLYHIKGWKAHLFTSLIRLVFTLGFQRWVFKIERVQIKKMSICDNINLYWSDWALFTGTSGPNQKYILYHQNVPGHNGVFTKIALTDQSATLIKNERSALNKLDSININSFRYPSVQSVYDGSVSLMEENRFLYRNNQWTKQHDQFIKTLMQKEETVLSFDDFDQSLQLTQRIDSLRNTRRKLPSGIIKKLKYLAQSLKEATIQTHLAHGDFTPWNCLIDHHNIMYVYDWELSSSMHPKGFDFFHFIMQDRILTGNKKWSDIHQEIKSKAKNLFNEKEADLYLSLYLLVNTVNYLEIYEKQNVWHVQIRWLLETWNMALSDVLSESIPVRKLLILDIFDQLHFAKYAGLKLNDKPENLSPYSDLDILMCKQTSKSLTRFLQHHPLVKKITRHPGFAMTRFMIVTNSQELLSLDAIHQLKRKTLEYMNVSELVEKPYIDRDGIKKVNFMEMIQFLGLFYGLNGALIPAKYNPYSDILYTGNKKLDGLINDQFYAKKPNTKALEFEVKKMKNNRGFSSLLNTITYVLDTALTMWYKKGMIITFSGVDGAGKSTIIENTKKEIEKKFRRSVVVIRHRPSLLPILSAWTKGKSEAEKIAAETLPRQGQNKSFLSSLLRFGYYYTDYLFGQLYIYVKHVLRGNVVLYDRYYFDFINDSLRSNIILPKWLLKSGYTFLLKPNLNFFLYADANTILSRKRELNEMTINKLTREYLDLFNSLGKVQGDKYKSIENINFEHTSAYINSTIQSKLI